MLNAIGGCTADLLPDPESTDGADASTAQQPPLTAAPGRSLPSGPQPAAAPARAGEIGIGLPPVAIDAGRASQPSQDASFAGPAGELEDDAGSATQPPDPPRLPPPIHRYDFGELGDIALDRAGDAHGRILGGASARDGAVELDGVDDCVELPPGLVSDTSELTLLLWLRWDGGECWQRGFDFSNVNPDSSESSVDSSLYAALSSCPTSAPAGGYVDAIGKEHAIASAPLAAPGPVQIGLVLDPNGQRLRLILDGAVAVEQPTRGSPAAIRDLNAYLGRSAYAGDPALRGALLEFRIYDRALDPDALRRVFELGPEAL